MNKFFSKLNWSLLALILLVAFIGLTPRIPVGTIDGLKRAINIRGEDIWILFLFFAWIAVFLKNRHKKIEKPPLFWPILFWTGVGFFSLLINWALDSLNTLRGFFYFAKELQFFFVYFFTFFIIKNLISAKIIIRIWAGIGLANIIWVLCQLFITGKKTGEYGTSALNEWGVFPTGSFFLILFIFLFNWWLYSFWRKGVSFKKEYLYLGIILSLILGMLGSLPRTVFLAFFFALAISLFLCAIKERTLKAALASFFLFLTISALTLGMYFSLIFPILRDGHRLTHVMSFAGVINKYNSSRIESAIKPEIKELKQNLALNNAEPETKDQFSEIEISQLSEPEKINNHKSWKIKEIFQLFSAYVLGSGKGSVKEAHNQYLRNFMETGIIGSIAFLILIISIFITAYKGFKAREPVLTGLSAGVITATATMLFMSLATEPFIVVKLSMTYWFFLGLAMAVLHNQKKWTEKFQ